MSTHEDEIAAPFRGAKTAKALRVAVELLMKDLPSAWSLESSHPSARKVAGKNSPHGQCYVSSMLLAHALAHCPIVDDIRIHRGAVYWPGGDSPIIPDHGWIEYRVQGVRFLSDVTAQQSRYTGPILSQEASKVHLEYRSLDVRTLSSVVSEDAWLRYFRLTFDLAVYRNSRQLCLI